MDVIKKINKKDLAKLLKEWGQDFSVFVPSQETGTVQMTIWQGQGIDSLDWYRNTVIPPKDSILPIMEEMFSFALSRSQRSFWYHSSMTIFCPQARMALLTS